MYDVPATAEAARAFLNQVGMDLSQPNFALPAFPDTARKIHLAISDPNMTFERLASVVVSEPALSVRLLRIANSVTLRRGPIEVTDVGMAISRIGLKMVQSIATMLATRESFTVPPGPAVPALQAARAHSLRVGVHAFLLAGSARFQGIPDDCMLAGVLQSVGRLYILMRAAAFPTLFGEADMLAEFTRRWQSGLARAIVGYWQFPEPIVLAVDTEETLARPAPPNPTPANGTLSDIVLIADRVSAMQSYTEEAVQVLFAEPALANALLRVGLQHDSLLHFLTQSEASINAMIEAMS